jgi:AcrR family transcriptional regulator
VPRAGVTRARVVETATRLADESGLEGLTLAAVAAELGVRTPSLYKHVEGLPSLRRLVAVRAKGDLAAVLGAASVGRARGDALGSLASAYRAWATDHPAAAAAAQAAPDPDDEDDVAASKAVTDVVFGALSGYGLSEDALVDATRSLRAALVGFAVLESGGAFGLARPVEASFRWWVDALDRALSAG